MSGIFSQYRGLRRENYILFFGRMVTNFGAMVWPMLTMILNQKMGMSAGDTALVLVAAGVLMLPASLLAGRLADRCNKRMLIVCGDLASILLYLICGLLPLSGASIVLMIAAAVFQRMEDPAYNALIADITPTERRDAAYSLQYLGANIGMVLSPTIAGFLFREHLWLAFLINGGAIACSTCLIFFGLKNIAPAADGGARSEYQAAREDDSLVRILRENPVLLLYLAIMAVESAAYQQFGYLMPLDLGRVHGEDGALVFGAVTSFNCLVVVALTPLFTRAFAHVSDPGKTLAGQCLQAAGFMVFALLLGRIPAYYVSMLLFTCGEIFITIAVGPFLANRIPASHRGRINGLDTVVCIAAQSASQTTSGRIFDRAGSGAAWGFTLGLCAISALLCVRLIFADRRRYPKLYQK